MAASSRRWPMAPTRHYGLDVTIVTGRPQHQTTAFCLPPAKLDFLHERNCLQSFDAVANNLPLVAWRRCSRKTRRCS